MLCCISCNFKVRTRTSMVRPARSSERWASSQHCSRASDPRGFIYSSSYFLMALPRISTIPFYDANFRRNSWTSWVVYLLFRGNKIGEHFSERISKTAFGLQEIQNLKVFSESNQITHQWHTRTELSYTANNKPSCWPIKFAIQLL